MAVVNTTDSSSLFQVIPFAPSLLPFASIEDDRGRCSLTGHLALCCVRRYFGHHSKERASDTSYQVS